MDRVVGLMWCQNEADILDFTIQKALKQVDHLFIADDRSTDKSWETINKYRKDASVYNITEPKVDKRQLLLNEAVHKFGTKNVLIQIIESDITILETDIRTAWEKYNNQNAAMSWHLINATDPDMWTDETGCYPTWDTPIDSKLTNGHWMESLSHYTFRPLDGVAFKYGDGRPWPRGLGKYLGEDMLRILSDAPLLAHWGYRGPKHWFAKYSKGPGTTHRKHSEWKMGTIEEVKATIPFFNGVWNGKKDQFVLNRTGWKEWIKTTWDRK